MAEETRADRPRTREDPELHDGEEIVLGPLQGITLAGRHAKEV